MGLFGKLFNRANTPEAFWAWFAEEAARYHSADFAKQPQLVQELFDRLRTSRSGLSVTLSVVRPDGSRELTISAEGMREHRAAVREMVAAAPEIPGWHVVAFRQPVAKDVSVEFEGFTLDWDSVRYVSRPSAGRLDVDLFVEGLTPANARPMMEAVFVLLDALIGEEAVMEALGELASESLALAPAGHRPLLDLRDEVRALSG